MLKNKNIALYITGGIAIYKTVDLMRTFIKEGANVRVAMTDSATRFINPLTYQVLSKNEVHTDIFYESNPEHLAHIDLSDWTDIAIVAPATANTIAKISHGIADNFVSSALLATKVPIMIVPAMNMDMFENDATQLNIKILKKRGIKVMEPETGFLAEGYEGKGRFPAKEKIMDELKQFILKHSKHLPLVGYKLLISAGGTRERIDPVRYISNESSGKMGYAIAKSAYYQGADVQLVTTKEHPLPKAIEKIKVSSADEMYQAINKRFNDTDILVMAAAVSDYKVKNQAQNKIKKNKTENQLTLSLEENPDIIKKMSQKKDKQYLVGFAAETENVEKYAFEKLKNKNLDMIVANDVSGENSGFNVDHNEVIILTKDGGRYELPRQHKEDIADRLVEKIIKEIKNSQIF